MREHDELRQQVWRRRQLVDLGPELGEVYLHSPEDWIIDKRGHDSLSRQTKHPGDIGSIIKSCGGALDFEYNPSWAARQGLTAIGEERLDQLGLKLGLEEDRVSRIVAEGDSTARSIFNSGVRLSGSLVQFDWNSPPV
jgi:hypothetical protein